MLTVSFSRYYRPACIRRLVNGLWLTLQDLNKLFAKQCYETVPPTVCCIICTVGFHRAQKWCISKKVPKQNCIGLKTCFFPYKFPLLATLLKKHFASLLCSSRLCSVAVEFFSLCPSPSLLYGQDEMCKVKDDSKPGSSLSSACPTLTLTKKHGSIVILSKKKKEEARHLSTGKIGKSAGHPSKPA